MGLYVYCVTPQDHQPPALTGIDEAAVELARLAGLGLWLTEHDHAPEPTLARIQQHNAVVEAAVTEAVTPVPVRFGQWTADQPGLRALVEPRAARFAELLALFAGALEFGLRILDPAAQAAQVVRPAASPASGRDYLVAVRDRLKAQEPSALLREQVEEAVRAHVRAEQMEPQATHAMFSVAHLVARSDFDAYRGAVEQLRNALPHLRFLLSGPWPPYTFSS